MSKPTIVFVPGLWETTAVFETVISTLRADSFPTVAISIPCNGQVYPNSGTLHDDVRAISSQLQPLLDEGNEIILVMHSAGGFLGSNAIEGMGLEARKKEGKKGGIRKLVYLTAGILPEGMMHPDLPFCERKDGRQIAISPETLLFNDLPPAEAQTWITKMQSHPDKWDGVITYCGWKDIPSIYLICEKDAAIPPPFQKQMAEMAKSEVAVCDAGHMVMLSQPEVVVGVVMKAAGQE